MKDWLDKRLIFIIYFLVVIYLIGLISGICLFHAEGMYYPISDEEKGYFIAFVLLSSFVNYRVQKEDLERAKLWFLLVIVIALGLYYCRLPVIAG